MHLYRTAIFVFRKFQTNEEKVIHYSWRKFQRQKIIKTSKHLVTTLIAAADGAILVCVWHYLLQSSSDSSELPGQIIDTIWARTKQWVRKQIYFIATFANTSSHCSHDSTQSQHKNVCLPVPRKITLMSSWITAEVNHGRVHEFFSTKRIEYWIWKSLSSSSRRISCVA